MTPVGSNLKSDYYASGTRQGMVGYVPKAMFRIPRSRNRILILGIGPLAQGLGQLLHLRSRMFTEVIGFVTEQDEQMEAGLAGGRIVGTMDQLTSIVKRNQVDTIAVCLTDRRSKLPIQTLLELKGLGIDIWDGNDLYEKESGCLSIENLKPSAIIFSRKFRRRVVGMMIKRSMDIILSLLGLVILLPLMAVIGLLIKIDSPGPVFYRQLRVGLEGKSFTILKFRSMFDDAEKNGPMWALDKDSRVSRVGRYLRKWRLDEIPQLINVLKGEMSLVGPRPERPMFVQELRSIIPYYDLRHVVRPGLTGWAQTQFRYGASKDDSHVKMQYDLYYVKYISIRMDVRILLETIRVVLRAEGAR